VVEQSGTVSAKQREWVVHRSVPRISTTATFVSVRMRRGRTEWNSECVVVKQIVWNRECVNQSDNTQTDCRKRHE
jgi:hypothetical protein